MRNQYIERWVKLYAIPNAVRNCSVPERRVLEVCRVMTGVDVSSDALFQVMIRYGMQWTKKCYAISRRYIDRVLNWCKAQGIEFQSKVVWDLPDPEVYFTTHKVRAFNRMAGKTTRARLEEYACGLENGPLLDEVIDKSDEWIRREIRRVEELNRYIRDEAKKR